MSSKRVPRPVNRPLAPGIILAIAGLVGLVMVLYAARLI